MDEKKKFTSEYFSKTAEYWSRVYSEDETFQGTNSSEMRLRKEIITDLVAEVSDSDEIRLLDCGCGTGAISDGCQEYAKRIHAMDLSYEMLSMLKADHQEMKAHTDLNVGDIENIPFKNESFDIVICAGVLQYLKHDARAIQELSRIVKDDGVLILTIPNILTLRYLLDPYYYLVRLPKLVISRLKRKLNIAPKTSEDQYDLSRNVDFSNRRYIMTALNKYFKQNRFQVKRIYTIGFGPITIFNKPIFSRTFSGRIENFFYRLSAVKAFGLFKMLANRWVIYLEKS